jgi:hypothetical protein
MEADAPCGLVRDCRARFLIWGIEVKGRSIEEIDAALTRHTPVKAPAEQTI